MLLKILLIALLVNWSSGESEEVYSPPEDSGDPNVEQFTNDVEEKVYIFFKIKTSWERGRAICKSQNATYAALKDDSVAEWVAEVLTRTDIMQQDLWIGGREEAPGQKLIWVDSQEPVETDITLLEFSPLRNVSIETNRTQCLAFERKSHDEPLFSKLDCRLPRAFICEKPLRGLDKAQMEGKIEFSSEGFVYTIFHMRKTWEDAQAYCLVRNMSLAVTDNMQVINAIARRMQRTRPVLESAWVGARWERGKNNNNIDGYYWQDERYLSPISLSASPNDPYPPWNELPKDGGCVMLDRHLYETPQFVCLHCAWRKPFVCQRNLKIKQNEREDSPVGNYYIPPYKLSWNLAQRDCNLRAVDTKIENRVYLAHIMNKDILNHIIYMMAVHPAEINHLWIGAKALPDQSGLFKMYWMLDNKAIDKEHEFQREVLGNVFCDEDKQLNVHMECINLDRENHDQALIYGLRCSFKQYFVCYSESGKFKVHRLERELQSGKFHVYNLTRNKVSAPVAPEMPLE